MTLLPDPRLQGRLALALAGAAFVLPAVVGVVGRTALGSREILQVEFAGTGRRLVELAGGSPERLETYRSLLGRGDNLYVAVYGTPLALGADLLPTPARWPGLGLTLATLSADVVENEALERGLRSLLQDPDEPDRADRPAALARRAAILKFACLAPALGLSVRGAVRAARRPL